MGAGDRVIFVNTRGRFGRGESFGEEGTTVVSQLNREAVQALSPGPRPGVAL